VKEKGVIILNDIRVQRRKNKRKGRKKRIYSLLAGEELPVLSGI